MIKKKKLKEFMRTKLVLQQILKGILNTKEADKCNHENLDQNLTPEVDKQMSRAESNTIKAIKWKELV
jgi:hypothetical protein